MFSVLEIERVELQTVSFARVKTRSWNIISEVNEENVPSRDKNALIYFG